MCVLLSLLEVSYDVKITAVSSIEEIQMRYGLVLKEMLQWTDSALTYTTISG